MCHTFTCDSREGVAHFSAAIDNDMLNSQPYANIFRNFYKQFKRHNMKKLFIISLTLLMATGAFAQRGYYHGGGYYARPRVSVGIGIGVPVYPYYGFGPLYPYSPFGFGYGYGPIYRYGYPYYRTPSKLDLEIQDIWNDYSHQIWLVKHDESLSRKERRKQVRELEHERDKAIIQAKRDYYEKPRRRHNFNSNNNSNS
jgi:hypothetical protein